MRLYRRARSFPLPCHSHPRAGWSQQQQQYRQQTADAFANGSLTSVTRRKNSETESDGCSQEKSEQSQMMQGNQIIVI